MSDTPLITRILDRLGLLEKCYVVESGTVSGWKYKKWSNGEYEATQEILVSGTLAALGGVFGVTLTAPAPPSDMLNAALSIAEINNYALWHAYPRSADRLYRIYSVAAGTLSNQPITFGAKGTWK